MDGEIWKDIPGYENLYRVSNRGRIKSLERLVWSKSSYRCRDYWQPVREKILKQHMRINGYVFVSLSKEGKTKYYDVHLLVAMGFLGLKQGSGMVVNHLNAIKTDNYVENLEVVTQKQNCAHTFKLGHMPIKFDHYMCKISEEQGYEMLELRLKHLWSLQKIGKIYSIGYQAVGNALKWIGHEKETTRKWRSEQLKLRKNGRQSS